MDSRDGRIDQLGHVGSAAKMVDYGVRLCDCDIGLHIDGMRQSQTTGKHKICDNSSCDNREGPHEGVMTPAQIRQILIDRNMTIRDLATRTGIDENHLTKSLSEKAAKPRRFKVEEMDAIKRELADEDTLEGVRTIPLLGKVPAGKFRAAEVKSGRRFPVDNSVPKNAYALTVDGESMNMFVDDGTPIIIDPDDISLWPENLYVIETESGEATFKQFLSDPARLTPCSDMDHEEIILGSQPIIVRGRVVSAIVKPAQLIRRRT